MSLLRRLGRILKAGVNVRRNEPMGHPDPFGAEPFKSGSGGGTPEDKEPLVDEELARYYANLEIPYGSDRETVKVAWKNLLRKYHPDLHSSDPDKQQVATELVKGLNQAYEQLSRRLS